LRIDRLQYGTRIIATPGGDGVAAFQVGDRVVFDMKAYVKTTENRRQGTWQQLVICDANTVTKVRFRCCL